MRCLAASNIAWAPEERLDAYASLAEAGFTGLEIAPGLFLPDAEDPFDPQESALRAARKEAEDHGLSLVSMQSLLFGVEGAALFGETEARARLTAGVGRAITLAGRLGIPNLVFGSPRQRVVPDEMTADAAWELALETFRTLGDRATEAGTVISIEPNPAAYGTNFLNTLEDAAAFVEAAGHPGITLILDLGAMHMNDQFARTPDLLSGMTARLSHVHISEPQLAPAPGPNTTLAPVLRALDARGYDGAISIEMRRPEEGVAGLEQCLHRLASASVSAKERVS